MRNRTVSVLLALAALALLVALPAAGVVGNSSARTDRADKQKTQEAASSYIVQMADAPVAGYEGGVDGYAATAPAKGKKLDANSANAKKYAAYLNGRHADAAGAVGADKFYDYNVAFNGFAAKMNEQQAAKLATVAGVVAVTKDVLHQPTTATSPSFLGLDAPNGLWSQLGGPEKAGEDVIVGIVDTGIWPEHPSFSDQKDFVFRTGSSGKRSLAYGPAPRGWSGTCQSGEQFAQDMCTNKLIGARYYLSGFGHFGIVKDDYKSARDWDSHGSHTASTAAGNHGVAATGAAAPFGKVSGMAPRARIAAYKVCWNGDAGGCANSDSMAAIDQAVADGVDVINFSISGTQTNFLDPVEVAFLFAARAGVFVAASAGNSGPDASTVAHPSPWITTVAASTQPRASEATATLGNGASYTGASSNQTPRSGAVVLSTAAGSGTTAQLCYPGSLNPAVVTGKIVVCDRGVIARVDKSKAVQQAGGIGMILANTSENSLNADLHWVPTVHVDHVAGAEIKAYVTSATAPTATLSAVSGTAPAPKMAAFSSRGPLLGAGGNLLKPDVTAPGVDILAAVSPDSGREFDLLSGTSMSSPHVAGLGALLKHKHPTWSPAAIKSALMTTAYDTVDGDVFAHGAGHVKPNAATDPGLVYDAGMNDWRGFLRGQGLCRFCFGETEASTIKATDLNVASIAIANLAGTQTVTRRVTNVGSSTATYSGDVIGLSGVSATITPQSLTLAPNETKTFTVKFDTNDSATYNAYTSGHLVWSDGTHTVRSPVVVKPVRLAAPAEVSGNGTAQSYSVTFGYTGAFSTSTRGLEVATETLGAVADDPSNSFVVGGAGTTLHTLNVPAGTSYARFALYDDQIAAGNDLDLYVYKGSTRVGASGSGTSQEIVNLKNPEPGDYKVYVHGWQTLGGGTASYTLFSWALGQTSAANMAVSAPSSATTGETASIGLTFTGLTSGKRYLGAVDYSNGSSTIGSTLVYQKAQ